MKIGNFFVAGIVAGIADFLLGWVIWGMLLRDFFEGPDPDMMCIALGCLFYGMLTSYVVVRWAGLATFAKGLGAGAGLGLFYALTADFFMKAHTPEITYEMLAVDVVAMIVAGAVVGGVAAAVNGAMSKPAAA
jgi:hypothetical protein